MALKNCIKSTANLNDDDVSDVLDAYQVNKDAGMTENESVKSAVLKVLNGAKAEKVDLLAQAKKQGIVPRETIPTDRMIGTGDQLYSQSGRKMSPAPKIDMTTSRKSTNSIKRLNAWLLHEAQQEAAGQDYLTTLLSAIDLNNISQSDQDTLNDVVFGDVDGPTAANRKVSLDNAKLRQEKQTDVVSPEISPRPLIEPPNKPAYSLVNVTNKKGEVGTRVVIDMTKYELDAPNFGYPEMIEVLQPGDPMLEITQDKYRPEGGAKHTYVPKQEAIHEKWRNEALEESRPVTEGRKPVAIVMGGGGASGKGTVLGGILEKIFVTGVFMHDGSVHADPDSIKVKSKEYQHAVKKADYRAASIVHEESSDVTNSIIDIATGTTVDPETEEVTVTPGMQRNIVIDKVMDDEVKGLKMIARLKKAGYEIHMIGVTVEPDTALIRALSRYFGSARLPLPKYVLPAHAGFNRNFVKYAAVVDSAELHDNNGNDPILVATAANGELDIRNKKLYNRVEQRGKLDGTEKTINEIRRKTNWVQDTSVEQGRVPGSAAREAGKRVSRRAESEERSRREQQQGKITQYGKVFESGRVVTFAYSHNTDSATKSYGKPKRDSDYGRWYEPSARYVVSVSAPERALPSNESGFITFNNPLVIPNDSYEWKEKLSHKYGNKRGKALSQALIDDGVDGVVTYEESGKTSEIVDLTTFDPALAMFSQKTKDAQGNKVVGKGLSLAEANAAIDKFKRNHKGYPDGLEIRVYADKESAFGADSVVELASQGVHTIKGAYIGDNNIVILIASDLNSTADAMETLQHEILAHYGLNLFTPANKQKIIDRIKASRGEPGLEKLWAEIDKNYADKSEDVKAEELLALIAQNKQGRLGKTWNAVKQMVRDFLIKMGWIKNTVTKTELNQLINAISDSIAQGVKQQTGINETMMSQEADTNHPSFKAWFKDSKVADRAGEPIIVYHGTTHLFDTFNKDRGEVGSDMGVGYYFTNSDYDADENYAGIGPDLTSRIQRLAEQLEYDDDGKTHSAAEAKRLATEQLSGGEQRQIEAYLSFKNPVIVGGENETTFWIERDHDYYMDMAKDEVDKAEFTDEDGELDQDGYDDQVREQADTFYYEDYNPQERGPGVELREAMVSTGYDFNINGANVWGDVTEDGGIEVSVAVSDFIESMKANDLVVYSQDENGELAGNEYIRAVFEEAGYDGIIDNTVDSKFGTQSGRMNQMAGMDADTVHYIAFQPNQIKSAVNNSGEFSLSNDNIYMSRKSDKGLPAIFQRQSGDGAQGVDTADFKHWFKGSKITNDDGSPMVVYHGTGAKFNEFNTEYGAYFTSRKGLSKKYAERVNGDRMIEVYLSLKNPLVVETDGDYWDEVNIGGFQVDEKTLNKIFPLLVSDYSIPDIVDAAKESGLGFDGVIFKDVKDSPIGRQMKADVYVAFEPNQIKSADPTQETFDINNDDIRFSQRTSKERQQDYMQELWDTSHPSFGRDRVIMNANRNNGEDFAMVEVRPFGENEIHISSIMSSETGRGNGSFALNRLIELADKHGLSMSLFADKFGTVKGALSTANLKKWYALHGFKPASKGNPNMTRPVNGGFDVNDPGIKFSKQINDRAGRCYECSADELIEGNLFSDRLEGWSLVHGIPKGQGAINGLRYGHAWLEKGNQVYDVVADVTMPKAAYYAMGRIKPEQTVKYTYTELKKKMVETGHYGPWDEAINDALHSNIKMSRQADVPKPNEVFRVSVGGNRIEVIQNPTDIDISQIIREVRNEFPNRFEGDPTLRWTNDQFGNRYAWKAHEGAHQFVEPEITKRTGEDVDQNNPDKFVYDSPNIMFSRQVQEGSPEFKKFFKGSKVVNDDGSPQVQYHGARFGIGFDVFRPAVSDIGMHFGTQGQANERLDYLPPSGPDGQYVMPVYLNIKNPIEITDIGSFDWYNIGYALEVAGINLTKKEQDSLSRIESTAAMLHEDGVSYSDQEFIDLGNNYKKLIHEALDKHGIDGIKYRNTGEVPGQQDFERKTRATTENQSLRSAAVAIWKNEQSLEYSYIALKPEQIKSAVGNTGAFDTTNKSILYSRNQEPNEGNLGMPEETRTEQWKRWLHDNFNRVKTLQSFIESRGGSVSHESDVYGTEERHSSKIVARLRVLDKERMRPLLEQMDRDDISVAELDAFLLARHAPERNDYIASINKNMPDGGSGLTYAEAADIMEMLKDKRQALEEAAERVYQVNDQNLDDLVAGGHLPADVVEGWKTRWQYYVPLKGKAEDETGVGGTGQGYSISGARIKAALGRGEGNLPESPTAHTFAQAETTIVRTEKTKIGQALISLIRENPDPDLWTMSKRTFGRFVDLYGEPFEGYDKAPEGLVENTDYHRVKAITPEEAALAKEEGRDPVPQVVYKLDPGYRNRDDIFTVMVNGQELLVNIKDELLNNQLKKMNTTQLNAVVRGAGMVNRYLAMINTALNPEFVITNFERDFQTAMINLAGEHSAGMAADVMKSIPSAMRGIWQSTFDTKGTSPWRAEFDEMQAAGGTIGFFGLEDIETRVKNIQGKLDGAHSVLGKTKKGILTARDLVLDANLSVENSARLAAYKVAKDRMISAGVPAAEARDKAASLAKNLTVNFNRKGELAPVLNSAYLFFNATIQGSFRIFQALQHKRVQKIVTGVALAAFNMALLNRAMGGDDEDDIPYWDKISDYTKQTNIIIMKPGTNGEYWKVRLPYGYNVFYYAGTAAADLMQDPRANASKTALNMVTAMLNAFNPLSGSDLIDTIMPTVIKPFTQADNNKNFMGAPIKPEFPFDQYDRPESQKYFKSTNPQLREMFAMINEMSGGDESHPGKVDVSPEIFKHYLGWITGGAGMFATRGLGTAVNLATGEDIEQRNVPFARTLGGKPGSHYDSARFYEAIKQTAAVKAQLKLLRGTDEYSEYRSEHSDVAKLDLQVSGYKKRIRNLRDMRDRAYKDEDTDLAADYREKIRAQYMSFAMKYDEAIEAEE